jgi:hypothetical protein
MKHTTQNLIDAARLYFPLIPPHEPSYDQTPEVQRQREALADARALYPAWLDLLRNIGARFPKDQHPGTQVQNLSLGLLSPASMVDDRCFSAHLWLPAREAAETAHALTVHVSFVVPYYSIRSDSWMRSRAYYVQMGGAGTDLRETYELALDELPYAAVLDEEIQSAFHGFERMPPDVGLTIVPGVQVGARMPDEATVYDCLFSCW